MSTNKIKYPRFILRFPDPVQKTERSCDKNVKAATSKCYRRWAGWNGMLSFRSNATAFQQRDGHYHWSTVDSRKISPVHVIIRIDRSGGLHELGRQFLCLRRLLKSGAEREKNAVVIQMFLTVFESLHILVHHDCHLTISFSLILEGDEPSGIKL